MRVREATSDDFDAIARLTVAAYRALPRWVGEDYALELADVAGRAGAPQTTVLVAESMVPDGAGGSAGSPVVLGSVTYTDLDSPYFEWAAAGAGGDCGFRMLAVDPAAQGRGAGPALVDECLRRARAAGRRRMMIASTEFMPTAHRIYARAGFRRAPELDPQWGDISGLCFVIDMNDP